jgi:hypothetical protein
MCSASTLPKQTDGSLMYMRHLTQNQHTASEQQRWRKEREKKKKKKRSNEKKHMQLPVLRFHTKHRSKKPPPQTELLLTVPEMRYVDELNVSGRVSVHWRIPFSFTFV